MTGENNSITRISNDKESPTTKLLFGAMWVVMGAIQAMMIDSLGYEPAVSLPAGILTVPITITLIYVMGAIALKIAKITGFMKVVR